MRRPNIFNDSQFNAQAENLTRDQQSVMIISTYRTHYGNYITRDPLSRHETISTLQATSSQRHVAFAAMQVASHSD